MKKLILILFVVLFVFSLSAKDIGLSTGNVKEIQKETKAPPRPYGPEAYNPRPEIDRAYATVGAGASLSGAYDTDITPFGTYYHDGRNQMLYTAAELSAAGLSAGLINSVGFNVGAASTQVMNGFNLSMGHTTETTMPAGWSVATLTNQYSGTWTAAAGWNDITTSFTWDGTSNIVVEVCFDNDSYTSNSTVYYDVYTGMHSQAYNDNTAGCSDPWETNPEERPQTRFGFTATVPVLIAAPSSYDYGTVNTGSCSGWITFTLSNGGTGTINVSNIALGGANPGEFQIQNNPAPCALPPNATIEVRFCPTTDGAKSADLVITHDVGRLTTNIPLIGTGFTYAQGDACSNPYIVGPLPYSHSDDSSLFTDTIGNASPDVWYEWTIDHAGDYTMTTCNAGSTFDTYIRLIADDCVTEITSNDDNCSGFSGTLSTIDCYSLTPGTYYGVVEGFSSYSGPYQVDFFECFEFGACCDYTDPLNPTCTDGVLPADCAEAWNAFHASPAVCADDPCAVPCVDCVDNEGEPCGTDVNGGCNMPAGTEYFTPLQCNTTVCGNMWADGGTRDTDWYDIYLEAGSTITLDIYSDISWVMGMVEDSGGWGTITCPATAFYQYTTGARCTPGQLVIDTPGPSGNYIIWVGPSDYYNWPCGQWEGNAYELTVTCTGGQPDPPTGVAITVTNTRDDVEVTWTVEAGLTYNVYSSADPYAAFPAGWTLEETGNTSGTYGEAAGAQKYYVVTANN
ncbi:MAG TPA: choice-of-anchor D domain-containing protein [Candidatus Cloacimonetes bacterium]|nr:choice-of-anchor D domain-containing protein [Candidatus Cloacimonadota bacterium]